MSQEKDIINLYKDDMFQFLKLAYPTLPSDVIMNALDDSIKKRYKAVPATLNNNYTKEKRETNLKDLTNWILEREPIMTAYGALFKKHAETENPLIKMIAMFMDNRAIHKAEMFKYPKGSEDFEKYNLLQLLDKIDCNAIYGILSAASSALYNIYVAGSITAQGRSLISSATMFFEMFLSNNVKFASLDEVLLFIKNVRSERYATDSRRRQYRDCDILDRDITPEECFAKLILTTGDFRHGAIKWIPDEKDMEIIWNSVCHMDQTDINRVYYKNNLYEFFENKSMTKALVYILEKMEHPFLNPNEVPDEIRVELETLLSLVQEYVFYNYQIIDRIERNKNMIKNVAIISDTDSAIVSFDAWYHFVLSKVEGVHLKISDEEMNKCVEAAMNMKWEPEMKEMELDFDFASDSIIQVPKKRKLMEFVTNKKLKFSILNIIAYLCSQLINEYMLAYTKSNHSYADGKKCLIIMKNEFTFGTTLLTMNKKNYATIQEVQEGNMIRGGDGKMDIKGLPINKSGLNPKVKKELQGILENDILMTDEIDQINIIKKLAILEKQIYESLHSGSPEYYKPATIKALSSYADPMRIQGIKAAVIWNAVRGEELAAIDLDARNTVNIIKVLITDKNIDRIKDRYPEVYDRFIYLFDDREHKLFGGDKKKEITSLAIPTDVQTPEWVLSFIDYNTIINDNLSNFPTESVNIITLNDNVNYTNIMKI